MRTVTLFLVISGLLPNFLWTGGTCRLGFNISLSSRATTVVSAVSIGIEGLSVNDQLRVLHKRLAQLPDGIAHFLRSGFPVCAFHAVIPELLEVAIASTRSVQEFGKLQHYLLHGPGLDFHRIVDPSPSTGEQKEFGVELGLPSQSTNRRCQHPASETPGLRLL